MLEARDWRSRNGGSTALPSDGGLVRTSGRPEAFWTISVS